MDEEIHPVCVSFEHILFRNEYGCSNEAHVVAYLKLS